MLGNLGLSLQLWQVALVRLMQVSSWGGAAVGTFAAVLRPSCRVKVTMWALLIHLVAGAAFYPAGSLDWFYCFYLRQFLT